MTASETLYIQTDLDTKALMKLLIPVADEDIAIDIQSDSPYWIWTGYANAIWEIREVPNNPLQSYAEAVYGFRETLLVIIRPPNEDDRKHNQDLLFKGVLKLIKTFPYNLGVTFHDDTDSLKHIDGKLTLFYHSDRIVWTPERLNMVGIPYEMKSWTFQ
jgi:hypothetical protein